LIFNGKRTIIRQINYGNGKYEICMKNYQTFGKLKKKLCEKYCLGMNIGVADEEKRMIDVDLILE
jgi:hypothetical protein